MIILGVAISGWASMNVNSTFNRYDQVQNQGNYTGKVAARYILDQAGLYEVEIREVAGNLTDNYNPTNKFSAFRSLFITLLLLPQLE